MPNRKNMIVAMALLLMVFTFAVPAVEAKDREYDQIVRHLKTRYRAKKVKIPFMWLARMAVSIARPAGVKSISVTLFQNLDFSRETLDAEMRDAMKNSLGEDWLPILRVRSRKGQQVYMYMRDAGKSVKIILVALDQKESAIVRATVDPEKLADFVNDPKVFGVSLNDNQQKVPEVSEGSTEKSPEGLKDLKELEKIAPAEKPKEEPKKDN